MIEDATNPEFMIEELTPKKPIKRRILVTALLSLAAFGTRYLPERALPRPDAELAMSQPVASDEKTAGISGDNSLFGEICVDQTLKPSTTEMSINQLEMSSDVEQAGLSGTMPPMLDEMGSASIARVFATSSEAPVPAVASLSSVPEPTAAGLLLLIAVPIGFRRRRQFGLAAKS
jgi:hypothetical protein